MTRVYDTLECGCLVSCDGGGGLYPCNYHRDNNSKPGDPLDKYNKEHDMLGGYCKVCHPLQYREELNRNCRIE